MMTGLLKRALLIVALLPLGGCGVAVGTAYPENAYYDDYPPDAYIATTTPYYYEGHASYWYGGRWYYRDGGSWRHYDREPHELYGRRMQAPPARYHYEAPRAYPQGHYGGGGRGGGGRGGHR